MRDGDALFQNDCGEDLLNQKIVIAAYLDHIKENKVLNIDGNAQSIYRTPGKLLAACVSVIPTLTFYEDTCWPFC